MEGVALGSRATDEMEYGDGSMWRVYRGSIKLCPTAPDDKLCSTVPDDHAINFHPYW